MSKNFSNQIKQLQRNLEEASNTKQLSFSELFNPEFLSECSSFTSIEDLFEKSGFHVESAEDFKAIPDDEWESFIVNNTSYESWGDMQSDAATKAMSKILKKGL